MTSPIHPYFSENIDEITRYFDLLSGEKPANPVTKFFLEPGQRYKLSSSLVESLPDSGRSESKEECNILPRFRECISFYAEMDKVRNEMANRSFLALSIGVVSSSIAFSSSFLPLSSFIKTAVKITGYVVSCFAGIAISFLARDLKKISLKEEERLSLTKQLFEDIKQNTPQEDWQEVSPPLSNSSPSVANTEVLIDAADTQQRPETVEAATSSASPLKASSFATLRLTLQDVETIKTLLKILAETNTIALATKGKTLSELGDKVNHVHPLKFLHVVLQSKDGFKNIQEIKGSLMKWNGFISGSIGKKGFADRFNQYEIRSYLADFYATVKIEDSPQLQQAVERKQWESFISLLIEAKKKSR